MHGDALEMVRQFEVNEAKRVLEFIMNQVRERLASEKLPNSLIVPLRGICIPTGLWSIKEIKMHQHTCITLNLRHVWKNEGHLLTDLAHLEGKPIQIVCPFVPKDSIPGLGDGQLEISGHAFDIVQDSLKQHLMRIDYFTELS